MPENWSYVTNRRSNMKHLLAVLVVLVGLAMPAAAQADTYADGITLYATPSIGTTQPIWAGNGTAMDSDVNLSMSVANGFWANREETVCFPYYHMYVAVIQPSTMMASATKLTALPPGSQCAADYERIWYDDHWFNGIQSRKAWPNSATTIRAAKRELCAVTVHEFGHLAGEKEYEQGSTYSIMHKNFSTSRIPTECQQWFP